MKFYDANILFSDIQPNDLNADEKAIVDFYKTSLAFSRAMVNYRMGNGINQKQLAEKLNTTQSNVSRYESGEHNFTIKKMFELAAQMNIDVDICIQGKGECKQSSTKADQALLESSLGLGGETDLLQGAA